MSYGPRKRRQVKKKVEEKGLETFAFLIHPFDIQDVVKKYKIAGKVSPKIVASILKRRRPFVISEISGIKSSTGAEAHGFFVVVPLLPWQFVELEEDYIMEKIAKACKVSQKVGAKIIGLGAFTAIPGGGGRLLANMVDVPITTGNTYTTTLAIKGAEEAAKVMGLSLRNSKTAIVGATGSIGKACAQILAPQVGNLTLVGRDQGRLEEVQSTIKESSGCDADVSCKISKALNEADVVVTVTGAVDSIIYPDDLKPGAIVCDVARPRDVSKLVSEVRDDVLVIDGGIVDVPGKAKFGVDIGLPSGKAEGCIAETIILTLEKRYENYTIGKSINVEMVKEMDALAKKHGFKLTGLRREEKLVTEQKIEEVKANARKAINLKQWTGVG
ncbi:MAG: shikimate dehydrogenase [Actinobacteria bacterium]|nr:MAG: shikimate dehydrogenase [Actinomycetota bacterium]